MIFAHYSFVIFFITDVLVSSEPFKAFAKGDENATDALQVLIQQVIKNLFATDDEEICDGDDTHRQGDE